jgi:hypothetical protein
MAREGLVCVSVDRIKADCKFNAPSGAGNVAVEVVQETKWCRKRGSRSDAGNSGRSGAGNSGRSGAGNQVVQETEW